MLTKIIKTYQKWKNTTIYTIFLCAFGFLYDQIKQNFTKLDFTCKSHII